MIPKSNDMRFEVATKCNYNCVICPREKLTRKKETMSLEFFKALFDKIIEENNQYDTLTFPGMGEPLLDETLDDKIKYAKEASPGIDVLLLTNGSLLSLKRFLDLQDLGLTSVRVSLYGTNPENYNKVHGITVKGVFEKVKENILKIAEAKGKTKLFLTYNIVKGENCSHLQDWIDFWKDKVDLLEVWQPHNWVTGRKYRIIQKDKLKTCGRPFNGPLQIQVDGTVNMCCFDFDGKLTIGDLKTQFLKDIFSSEIFKKIVKCHKLGDFSGSGLICEYCDQRNANKSDVMRYNSKFDIKERVNMISTTYKKIL